MSTEHPGNHRGAHLAVLAALGQRYTTARRRELMLWGKLREACNAARADGLSVSDVAKAAGLSRKAVYGAIRTGLPR